MKLKYTNKINKIRTFALSLVFVGILIMYVGIFFKEHPVIMVIAMILGFLAVIASTVVYFLLAFFRRERFLSYARHAKSKQKYSAVSMRACIAISH